MLSDMFSKDENKSFWWWRSVYFKQIQKSQRIDASIHAAESLLFEALFLYRLCLQHPPKVEVKPSHDDKSDHRIVPRIREATKMDKIKKLWLPLYLLDKTRGGTVQNFK